MSNEAHCEKHVEMGRVVYERRWKEATFHATAWPSGNGPVMLDVRQEDGSVLRMVLPEALVPEGSEGRRGHWRFTVSFQPDAPDGWTR